MQFNSYVFVLAFLPLTVVAYFLANRFSRRAGKFVLIAASFLFYGWGAPGTLPVLLCSLAVNYAFAWAICRRNGAAESISQQNTANDAVSAQNRITVEEDDRQPHKKKTGWLVAVPVILNILLLFYFKYLNFAVFNINRFLHTNLPFQELLLPVGISFFTFQQIAYVVSVYRGDLLKADLIDYLVYLTYFPKILMGPLAEPADLIGQFNDERNSHFSWENTACGLKIFSFGLLKKVILADTFGKALTWGMTNMGSASAMDWILVSICYSFEIYFDFSGYSDMAVGVSKMLNITLPINFDSPYKALSIRDFWKRWHISLTKFLTKYLYIPLGGNRKGTARTYINTMIVFLVSGIWHGANWNFILWGLMHGLFSVFDRITERVQEKVWKPIRWLYAFAVYNVLWLLFTCSSVNQWLVILKTMVGMNSTAVSTGLMEVFHLPEAGFLEQMLPAFGNFAGSAPWLWMIVILVTAMLVCLIPENNYRRLDRLNTGNMIASALAFVWGVLCLGSETIFVYFNF